MPSIALQEELTSSSEEGDEGKQREVVDSLQTRYKWKSNLDFLIISTVYSTTSYNFKALIDSTTLETNFVDKAICCLLIGMPLQYMQVALGQYCERSILNIKYMSTLGFGVGLMFIISSVIESAPNAVYAGDALLYILNCFQKTLPWMECKPKYNKTCWTGSCKGPEPCIKGNVITATRLYWNVTLTHVNNTEIVADFKRLIAVYFVWIAIFWYLSTITVFSATRLKRMYMVTVVSRCLIIIMMLIMCDGATNGLKHLFTINFAVSYFFNGHIWLESISSMLVVLSIDKGGYMMFGSYMARRQSAGNLTVIATLLTYLNKASYVVMFQIAHAIIAEAAKLPPDKKATLIESTAEPVSFTIILNGLGYTHAPHIWSAIFLIDIIAESFSYFVLMIQACEIAFQDIYAQYFRYRKYILFGVVFICQFLCIPYVFRGVFKDYVDILPNIKTTFSTMNLFLFALLVSWMYGVQRLCDDLHFITGQQPARFWKISWYISPFIVGICMVAQVRNLVEIGGTSGILTFMLMLIVPFITVILQTIKHFKHGDQGGFFISEERWGPPNAMDRYLRAIFNPRKETKSRRRYDICQHKCLLQCSALAKSSLEKKERSMNQKIQRRQVF